MRHRFARMGTRAWLATSPDTHAFGNAILNVTWSFYMARATGAVLCLEPTSSTHYPALWRVECQGVDSVRAGSAGAKHMGRVLTSLSWLPFPMDRLSRTMYVTGPTAPPPNTIDPWLYYPSFGLNMRRLLAEEPLAVGLSEEDLREVQPQVQALGLSDGQPMVTIHVREGGSKTASGITDRAKDVVRNASLDSYLPAIDWLVSRGFLVVRIGDPSMRPLRRDGVVDLATFPARSLALDLFCVQRSAFFLATDSGPFNLALLCDVPCLATNVTHFLGAYPVRAKDRYLLRHTYDATDRHELTLAEMLTPHHLKYRFDPGHVVFQENTPEEITAATQEMVRQLERPSEPTLEQGAVREAIETFLASDFGQRKLKLAVSGTTEPYYLGLGLTTAQCASALMPKEPPVGAPAADPTHHA